MILSQIRRGKLPVVAGYRGERLIYRRDNGVELVEADYTGYGVTVKCSNGVVCVDGQVRDVSALFVRLSHSLVTGTTNTVMADPSWIIVPAGKTTTLAVEALAGSCDNVTDGFNIVLRDSGNGAAVNCKFAEGMRKATAAHPNALAVFCLYLKAGCVFHRLTVLPSILYQ